jgi:hypothetical protein
LTGWCCSPGLDAAVSGFFPRSPCAYAAALAPTTNDNSVKLKTRAPFIGRASNGRTIPEVRTVGPKKATLDAVALSRCVHMQGQLPCPLRCYPMVKEDC